MQEGRRKEYPGAIFTEYFIETFLPGNLPFSVSAMTQMLQNERITPSLVGAAISMGGRAV